jgi:Fe-S-cluster containining protein
MTDAMPAEARLRVDSPFGYQCNRCRRCCSRYMIQVNPYEILHSAAHFGIDTTETLQRYVQPDRPWLKRGEDGACVFLTETGCGIHPHRPLVCRVYPLGARYDDDEEMYFFNMALQEGSAGEFSASGRVGDYLAAQGCQPYFEAARRSNALRRRLLDHMAAGGEFLAPKGFGDNPMEWLDVDKVCALAGKVPPDSSVSTRFGHYEAALGDWLSS